MAQQCDKELLTRHGYKLNGKIGQGSFSTVYKASHDNVGECAIKILKFNVRSAKEIQVLIGLHHENIVKYIQHFNSSTFIYLVTEFCDAGDLERYILHRHKLAESLVKIIMQQLALAMQYLKSENICHMDIKPKNILVCTKPRLTFKLSDFGIAEVVTAQDMEKWRENGTIAYMAPEKLTGKPYDIRSDLWSIGIVMFQCLFGRPWHFQLSLNDVKTFINKEKLIEIPNHSHVSSLCEELLHGLLKYNPEERIQFEDFYNHKFLDLNNMPNSDNYQNIIKIINTAIALETEKKFEESLQKYQEAVALLHPYIETETNFTQREKLELKFHQYIQRINELSRLLNSKFVQPQLPSSSFDMLRIMVQSTPKLATGIEIGIVAEEYLAEGKTSLAFSKIYEALDVLVPLCATEPQGYRKTLLIAQINKWLTLGEELKKQD